MLSQIVLLDILRINTYSIFTTGLQTSQGQNVAADHAAVSLLRRRVRLPRQRHHHPALGTRHYQVLN